MLGQQEKFKRQVAEKAIEYIVSDTYIGIGTGSTVHYFIEALECKKNMILGAVSSSRATTEHLRKIGVEVIELNEIDKLSLYVDGADEVDEQFNLIKGGGGALTQEKIIVASSDYFICIVDHSKCVDKLGKFPVPLEVIPMARSAVAREMVKRYQAEPVYREGVLTDNGNIILDVHCLDITDPKQMEIELNQIPGIICHGIFHQQAADKLIVAGKNGICEYTHPLSEESLQPYNHPIPLS